MPRPVLLQTLPIPLFSPHPVSAEWCLGAAQWLLPCVQGMGQGASYIWEVTQPVVGNGGDSAQTSGRALLRALSSTALGRAHWLWWVSGCPQLGPGTVSCRFIPCLVTLGRGLLWTCRTWAGSQHSGSPVACARSQVRGPRTVFQSTTAGPVGGLRDPFRTRVHCWVV